MRNYPPASDGCSVPNLFRPLLPQENDLERLACDVHDQTYHGLDPWVEDRATADSALYDGLVGAGMPGWKAWVYWAGVRIGGAWHWEAKT